MKAVIQRVMKASVTVGEETVGSIGRGVCVLLGISRDDTEKEMEYMIRKILNTRIFEDSNRKNWAKSVVDLDYEVLCVSQFTLDVYLKGNKPEFRRAMGPDGAQPFYNRFIQELRSKYKPEKIQEGSFGAMMQVHIQNDGPVTLVLERNADVKDGSKEKKDENGGATADNVES